MKTASKTDGSFSLTRSVVPVVRETTSVKAPGASAVARLLSIAVGMALLVCTTSYADPVRLDYEARIETISGNPFGLDSSARLTSVGGFFLFESDTPEDAAPFGADPIRARYSHTGGGGGFFADFDDSLSLASITGSSTPVTEVINFDPASDNFNFYDGVNNLPVGGMMTAVGSPNADSSIELTLLLTDPGGTAFATGTDDLSNVFPSELQIPPSSPSHTFMLSDSGGTLLLQFNTIQQVPIPEPAISLLISLALGMLVTVRRRRSQP